MISYIFIREKSHYVQEAVLAGGRTGEGCPGLWQALPEGKDRHPPAELQPEGTSALAQRSRWQQGLAPTLPHVPLENFTSPSCLPSREHKGAGEAAFISCKGKARFNHVKVKQGKLPAGGELTPAINFSRSGVDLSLQTFNSGPGVFPPEMF